MIEATQFCEELQAHRVGFIAGVPCSFFSGPISLLERSGASYVSAANEGAALAMAAGAEVTGVRSAVLLQNSGFGNLLNPLTSLVGVFDIPVLVFMSLRGWPDPARDEPQHAVMGLAGHRLLEALEVAHWTLRPELDSLRESLDRAEALRERGRPMFILVPKGTIGAAPRVAPPAGGGFRRGEAVAAVAPHLDDALVFATTGYISRELSAVADRPLNFYMPGSMGHALALGLGAAVTNPHERVVVLDGDGAVLMHLGTLATVGAYSPPNLVHVVLDNGSYESTGGQPTIAPALRWTELGVGAGYRSVTECADVGGLDAAMRKAADTPGPHLVVARIAADATTVPPRVTARGTPPELRCRFEDAVAERTGTARPR